MCSLKCTILIIITRRLRVNLGQLFQVRGNIISMKKFLVIVVLGLMWIIPVSANERFIPLELFTGGEIREDTEIKFTKANKIFGEKKRKKIVGPEDWKNPQTGEIIKVYKRTREGQSGLKTQLFTVTNDCLLYTSPSPRDRQKSRMPSSA